MWKVVVKLPGFGLATAFLVRMGFPEKFFERFCKGFYEVSCVAGSTESSELMISQ